MVLVSIDDPTEVYTARSEAARFAASLGMSASQKAKLALVVTEAGTNLIKHAGSGFIILTLAGNDPECGVDVVSIDRGPGMADLERCLEDGFSTAGSPGTGLGAIRRLADFFDVYTEPGRGTVLMARIGKDENAPCPPAGRLEAGVVCLPIKGESACGDSWGMVAWDQGATVMVADGLGHGPLAAEASGRAVGRLCDGCNDPSAILGDAHASLRGTRGAAVGVAVVDLAGSKLRFAGVGNIVGVILTPGSHRHVVSHPGIVGQEMRKVQEFQYDLPDQWVLVMHSDGMTAHWNLDDHPGLLRRHPLIVAALLWRDFSRGRDDVTVVVARVPS